MNQYVRTITSLTASSIATEVKKIGLKIGSVEVKKIINQKQFWSEFLVFFKNYVESQKK
jgi:hypothetical protein